MFRIEGRRRLTGAASPSSSPDDDGWVVPPGAPDLYADPDADPDATVEASVSSGRSATASGPGEATAESVAAAAPTRSLGDRLEAFGDSRWPVRGLLVSALVGALALLAALVPIGPGWLGRAGAVIIASNFSWALAGRTGGRPVVFGTLAAALGLATVLSGRDDLATGAAVSTSVVSAVLAVMITVPAVTFLRAGRECLVAVLVAGIGALATVGFEPAISVDDFEYATFGLALAFVLVVVYRLGAGLHGLGRRGVVIVVVGGVLVAVTVLYAELLRRYGTPSLVESSLDVVRWGREHLGAFPRPIEAVLGVPALAYGVHMRARRRQGWWVCAFGVAATSATAGCLANPAITVTESALSVLYGLVVGLVIGFLVIRLDLFFTGAGGAARSRGRRSRVDEEAEAVRPEPRRTEALF